MFDWYGRCAYDGAQKKLFHQNRRAALRVLTKELRLPPNSFDIRSALAASPSPAYKARAQSVPLNRL